MPKELLEIGRFDRGVIGSIEETDLPAGSSVYQLNVDPVAPGGRLQGIEADTSQGGNKAVNARIGRFIDFPGQKDLVYIDQSDVLHAIEDWYGTPSTDQIGSNDTGATCLVVHNHQAHVGRGQSTGRFVGYITGQSGIQNELADLVSSGVTSVGASFADNNIKLQDLRNEKHKLFLAYSLIFDEVQEGTLVELFGTDITQDLTVSNPGGESTDVVVNPGTVNEFYVRFETGETSKDVPAIARDYNVRLSKGSLPVRATHVNLYLAWSIDDQADDPDTDYFLINTWAVDDDNAGTYEYTYNWNDVLGLTYQASSGRPVTLTESDVTWGLSTMINGSHVIGDVRVSGLDYGQNYLFKSVTNAPNTFNWPVENTLLSEKPVALASFAGRIFAFSKKAIFRIDPSNMAVEDVTEGIGALSDTAVVVTEFGMFFADAGNIYMHDGSRITPIGDPILHNQYDTSLGWLELDFNRGPFLAFDNSKGSLLVVAGDSSETEVALLYSLRTESWGYVDLGGAAPNGIVTGVNGEILYSSNISTMNELFTGASRRQWKWVSPFFVVNQPTLPKIFYELVIHGEFTSSVIADGDVVVRYTTNPETDGGTWETATLTEELANRRLIAKINSGGTSLTDQWDQARGIQFEITGEGDEIVNGIGVRFRRLYPLNEG